MRGLRSIRNQLVILQLLVTSVVLVLYGLFGFVHDARFNRESLERTLSTLAEMVGYNCTASLNFLDPDSARRTLASLAVERQVTHAWILDPGRRVFADFRREGQPDIPPTATEDGFDRAGGRFVSLSQSIVQDAEVIGHVVLRYDTERDRRALWRKHLVSASALFAGLGVAFLLAVFAQRAISRPLVALAGTIGEVTASKDFSIRVDEERPDEIGVLSRGFDDLLRQLQVHESERDQAEAALRDSEEKYRTLVERAIDGILIIQEGRIVYANPSLTEMSGGPPEEILGSRFSDWVVETDVARLADLYARRMRGEPAPSMYETVFRRRDGQLIAAEVNAAVVPYRGRDADLVIIRNINERRRAEEQIRKLNEDLERRVVERTRELAAANARLVELDQLKSMFLASMSHELRTPLNSILGFTGLLLMGLSSDLNEEQTRQLRMVQKSANHLLQLINDILDISKIEAGRVELLLEDVPVGDLVAEVCQSLAPLAREKGIELVHDVPEDLVLHSDRRRVKQLLVNIVGNAVKFTERGSVRVRGTDLGDAGAEVEVEDTGIGIPPADLEKLFQPFQQVDMSSTKRFEGTGLGLYLCRKIGTLLGGGISAASEPGKGSRFTIALPKRAKEGGADEDGPDRRG